MITEIPTKQRRAATKIVLSSAIALLAACSGGGSGGQGGASGIGGSGGGDAASTLNVDRELRRLSAIANYTFDMLSILYPMSRQYLADRVDVGNIACPSGGTFDVAALPDSEFRAAFSDCALGWGTVDGTISTRTNTDNRTIYTLDISWDGLTASGEFAPRHGEGAPPDFVDLLDAGRVDIALDTGGSYTNLGGGPRLGLFATETFRFIRRFDITDTVNSGTFNMRDGDEPPVSDINALDGSGHFYRVAPTRAGQLIYERNTNTQSVFANIAVTGESLDVEFIEFGGRVVASRQTTWTQVFATTPIYNPND